MPKTYSQFSKNLLELIAQSEQTMLHDIYEAHKQSKSRKLIYNTLYRLAKDQLIAGHGEFVKITPLGLSFIHKFLPQKDGIWKIIIFDIPETKRKARNFLRSQLRSLGFRKWQSSIWISPFALDPEVEAELNELSKKYFVRLIKSTDINYTDDLEKLFPEK